MGGAETAVVVELDRMRTHLHMNAACRGAAVGGARDVTERLPMARGETHRRAAGFVVRVR